MDFSTEVFSHQVPVVFFFVHHLACYRGLKAAGGQDHGAQRILGVHG
jgi:hypothetical protein